ncbi:hypothetical protein FZ025_16720 [Xanthomonas hyacinthi]|uniref:Uncharacterized protein n=1 Tax=Xanthomonas hyacinthi TaxID=56455 RepID=A0A2S7F1M8_9XANT|nr:hypothetical protein [Xanthomonas hyacinthi]KLD78336.1 hypothetical protein Y886_10755 [Xanthomonas hyacinthi DSM 19077]PPU99214.1 hypothetical protein XhyaCFBP1156_02780 [Xanthomonas hyacinthi]QGY78195.1 hypothetical protein FZ025_16720 [Xanthomonas hyacinthi]
MSDNEQIRGDHDASLLEGLYQLVVGGHTQGWEFDQLNSEVYDRLKQTYEHAAIGSAQVQLRGQQAA